MGNPKGFLEVHRQEAGYRPVATRLQDFDEVEVQLPEEERKLQASRCMECGVPFCHWGCPVCNIMPEWQDAIFRGDWQQAYEILSSTNNFPEFTGRVCPALCEAACVLALDDAAVTIRQNEWAVVEKAFELGIVKPNPPKNRTGKKVAVIGSGPAGLACADQLNKEGHSVTLFEAEEAVGGYLRFGIPDFKLDKAVIDRRVDILVAEGLEIKLNTRVGEDISVEDLKKDFDAICLTIGAREPRDLPIEGRDLQGVHFALEYLTQHNRSVRSKEFAGDHLIQSYGKKVLVIGGGDTGSDCVGTANRQGASLVSQIEIMPQPPKERTEDMPWPLFPRLLKTSSSHAEGCERDWNVATKKFIGDEAGKLKKVLAIKVEWTQTDDGKWNMKEIAGSEFEIEADLALLAMGFVSPVKKGLVEDLGVDLDTRGNIKTDDQLMTSEAGIFAAGDAQRGASLVVWGIADGRKAAAGISEYLMKK